MRPATNHTSAARLLLCLLASLLLLPSMRSGRAGELPFVFEQVEEIAVITVKDSPHQRVVFLRDGKAFATRLLIDEMQWIAADGAFHLVWAGYYSAQRVVETRRISSWNLANDPADQSNLEWWAMARNMRELRAPE